MSGAAGRVFTLNTIHTPLVGGAGGEAASRDQAVTSRKRRANGKTIAAGQKKKMLTEVSIFYWRGNR